MIKIVRLNEIQAVFPESGIQMNKIERKRGKLPGESAGIPGGGYSIANMLREEKRRAMDVKAEETDEVTIKSQELSICRISRPRTTLKSEHCVKQSGRNFPRDRRFLVENFRHLHQFQMSLLIRSPLFRFKTKMMCLPD